MRYPLLKKGETSSCQTAHNEIVKEPPLTKHFYMSDSFFLSETAINELRLKSFSCLKEMYCILDMDSPFSAAAKGNIPSLAKHFQLRTLD